MDFKRLSQHRAQQLPLGGLLGERLEKSLALYSSQQREERSPDAAHKSDLAARQPGQPGAGVANSV